MLGSCHAIHEANLTQAEAAVPALLMLDSCHAIHEANTTLINLQSTAF